MRSANQQTNYMVARYPSKLPSPHAPVYTSRYRVEKLVGSGWVCMSHGDVDREAPTGQELDRLIRRAEILEGETRIVRRDGVVIWPAKLANGEGAEST